MTDRRLTSLPRRLRQEGGFGLIELMVAMTVLNVGILAVFAGFSSAYTSLNRASEPFKWCGARPVAGRAIPRGQVLGHLSQQHDNGLHPHRGRTRRHGRRNLHDERPALVTLRTGVTGPDNRLFRVDTYVVWACPVGP